MDNHNNGKSKSSDNDYKESVNNTGITANTTTKIIFKMRTETIFCRYGKL